MAKKLHRQQKIGKVGVVSGSVIHLVPRIEGGGKRARAPLVELSSKESDIEAVKACFALTAFNAEAWVVSLDETTRKDYKAFVEANRSNDRVVQKTIETIIEYKNLKAWLVSFVPLFFCYVSEFFTLVSNCSNPRLKLITTYF